MQYFIHLRNINLAIGIDNAGNDHNRALFFGDAFVFVQHSMLIQVFTKFHLISAANFSDH